MRKTMTTPLHLQNNSGSASMLINASQKLKMRKTISKQNRKSTTRNSEAGKKEKPVGPVPSGSTMTKYASKREVSSKSHLLAKDSVVIC